MAWRAFTDPRDADPEVRRERVKLLAAAVNAVGVALFLGAVFAPALDPDRSFSLLRSVMGVAGGGAFIFAGWIILRYIKAKE